MRLRTCWKFCCFGPNICILLVSAVASVDMCSAYFIHGDVWTVDDESIRTFVTNPPIVDYFSDLIVFLRKQSHALDGLVTEVSK